MSYDRSSTTTAGRNPFEPHLAVTSSYDNRDDVNNSHLSPQPLQAEYLSSPSTPVIDRSQTSSPLISSEAAPTVGALPTVSAPSRGTPSRRRLPIHGGSFSSLWSSASSIRGTKAGLDQVKREQDEGMAPPPAFHAIDEDSIAYEVSGDEVEAGRSGARRRSGPRGDIANDDGTGFASSVEGENGRPLSRNRSGAGGLPLTSTSSSSRPSIRHGSEDGSVSFQNRFTQLFRRSTRRGPNSSQRSSLEQDPSIVGDELENGIRLNTPAPSVRGYVAYEDDGMDDHIKPPSMIKLFKEDYVKIIKWMKTTSWKEHRKKACAAYLWKWYGIIVLFVAIGVLLGAKHNTVVRWLEPKVDVVKHLPAGWLVPIAILFIISFPPLVGHEVIGILCGVIYGLGVGFAILAAGTFFGELGEWFAFKACCTSRAAKFEKKNQYYSALTQLIREKSFMFVLILRFSAVPGHLTTALSASAGANLFSYCMAAILTLPKQLTLVYLGVAFESTDKKSHYISVGTTGLTIVMTGVAAAYIYYQMRLLLIRQERRAQRAEAAAAAMSPQMATLPHSTSVISFDDKLRAAGYPPAYRPSPQYELLDADNQRTGGRRPHLRTQSSMVGDRQVPVRAKSLPGNGTSELEAYVASLREAGGTRNSAGSDFEVAITGAEEEEEELTIQPVAESSAMAQSTTLASPRYLGLTSEFQNRPRSGTGASVGSTASTAPLVPIEDAGQAVRGTTSLDMWRPVHMTLEDAAQRMSGREIALDADRYAVANGGRRPDMNRLRGDSSAALLGRPSGRQDMT